jgi:hypothetical protein
MADSSHQLVQKLWNYCNILREDGLSYGDYPSAWFILSVADGLRTACWCGPSCAYTQASTQTGL